MESRLCSRYIGWECVFIANDRDGTTLSLKDEHGLESKIHTKYLIAADGANSMIRKAIGIQMSGEVGLQTLLNVFFRCKGLSRLMTQRPSMLYFVFNQASLDHENVQFD